MGLPIFQTGICAFETKINSPYQWTQQPRLLQSAYQNRIEFVDVELMQGSNQPQSALALWFKERVNRNGGRLKKTTIVALARKLLVALWKYVTAGVVIEGAIMKSA